MTRNDQKIILEELRATNLPFELRRDKGKVKVLILGQLVGVAPADNKSEREALMNVRAQIRRFVKGHTNAANS